MIRNPAIKLLRRWQENTKNCMIAELTAALNDKAASFNKLQEIHGKLEHKNNALLVENEDMRQSSMDGLEIANVNFRTDSVGCANYGQRSRTT